MTLATEHRPEDLLLGALAVLSLKGHTTLRTTDRSFHEHFSNALAIFRQAGGELGELASMYYKDIVSKTYDELDHALITAEQYRFVSFPNPSYSRLQIKMTPRAAQRLLDDWDQSQQAVLEQAADALRASIER